MVELAEGANGETGVVPRPQVVVRFEDPEGDVPGFAVGQPVALAKSKTESAFPIPKSALERVGDTYRVMVIDDNNRVAARPVTVRSVSVDRAVVIQGLKAGDQVAYGSKDPLEVGTPVRAWK